MKRTALALTLISAIMFLSIVGTQFVGLASGNFLPPPPELPYLYIKADGTVEPQTATIQRIGETYTFTENIINHTLEVQRDGVVVDGAGFLLQGNGTGKGIVLTSMVNVTIRDLTLRNLRIGIYLNQSVGNTITRNDITSTESGIFSESSSNNDIFENDITGNSVAGIVLIEYSNHNNIFKNRILESGVAGIMLEFANNHTSDYNNIMQNDITDNKAFGIRISSSSNCQIEGNNIRNSEWGIQLSGSACGNNKFVGNSITNCSSFGIQMSADINDNSIVENTIANNKVGVDIFASNNNEFYRNNFVNNTVQVNNGYVEDINSSLGASINIWDNGTVGNYWSDYQTKYPNATEIGSSGVGNTPYIIDGNNIDHYPLMKPAAIPELPDGAGNNGTDKREPFPNLLVIAVTVTILATVAVGLLVYSKKHRRIGS